MDEHPICRAIGLFPGVSSRTCGRGEPTNGGLPCHLTQLLPLHQKSPLCLMPLSPQMVAIHTACARCLIFFEYTGNRLVYTSPHKSQEECVPKGVSKVSPCFEVNESIFGLGFTQIHGFATILTNNILRHKFIIPVASRIGCYCVLHPSAMRSLIVPPRTARVLPS